MEETESVDEMVTSKEAARLLGLTEGRLRKMRSLQPGRLPFYKIDRSVRYERTAVLAFRSSCRVQVAA